MSRAELRRALERAPALRLAADRVWGARRRAADAGPTVLPTLPDDGARPVLVCGTAWRSGSTLVQRLVASGGVAMWGEPLTRVGLWPALAEGLRSVTAVWPERASIDEEGRRRAWSDPTDSWMATVSPTPEDLLHALRSLTERLYAEPARSAGFGRWGLKEVRFGRDEIELLWRIHPGMRVVIVRRPVEDGYRSYRAQPWFYDRWPDQVTGPTGYARVWRRVDRAARELADDERVLVVEHTDLRSEPEPTLRRLDSHLDIECDRGALDSVVGSSVGWTDRPLSRTEALLLRRGVR